MEKRARVVQRQNRSMVRIRREFDSLLGLMAEIIKMVVFVPETHADAVRKVLGEAGAGVIGNYSFCTFTTKGVGRFKAEKGARPSVGKVGKLETVSEERIETVCRKDIVKDVVAAIKKVHPYEEVPIDIYPLLRNGAD